MLAATAGSAGSQIHSLTIGFFIKPITEDLGWSVSDVTLAILICSIVSLPGAPACGWLAERYGLKRIILWGILPFFVSFASIGMLSHTHIQWIVGWTFVAVLSLPVKGNIWSLWAARTFHKSRGMAFAVVTSGGGIFAIFMPFVTQALISGLGWRLSFPALALLGFALVFPLCFLAFRAGSADPRLDQTSIKTPAAGTIAHSGMSIREATGRLQFWQLLLISLMLGIAITSVQIHLVPMFQAKQLTARDVAGVASVLGMSSLAGRFAAGALLDKIPGRVVGALSMLLPTCACLLYLGANIDVSHAVAIAILFGFGMGAEGDVLAYITGEYFGVRNFGTIFGIVTAFIAFGAGLGPFVLALVRDHFHSYDPMVQILFVVFVVGFLLIASLGRAPEFSRMKHKPVEKSE